MKGMQNHSKLFEVPVFLLLISRRFFSQDAQKYQITRVISGLFPRFPPQILPGQNDEQNAAIFRAGLWMV